MKKVLSKKFCNITVSLISISTISCFGFSSSALALDIPNPINSINKSINSIKNMASPAQALYNSMHSNVKITNSDYTNMVNSINNLNKTISPCILSNKDLTDIQYKNCQSYLTKINYKVLVGANFDQYKNLVKSLDITYSYYNKLKYQDGLSKSINSLKQVKLYRIMGITKIGPYTAPKWMGGFITMTANLSDSLKNISSMKLDNLNVLVKTLTNAANQINPQAAVASATLEDLSNIAHNFSFLVTATDFVKTK